MSIDVRGYKEAMHISMGYRAFHRLREDLLPATPLGFRLEHQLWFESAWDGIFPMPGPYIDYTDFPDWDATPMMERLWELYAHPDHTGGWEDPKGTAELLGILRDRLPDGSRVDRELLDTLIELFSVSDVVRFQ